MLVLFIGMLYSQFILFRGYLRESYRKASIVTREFPLPARDGLVIFSLTKERSYI